MTASYRRGLHELGDGLFAYLQPDGTWGWSNAGLITAEGTSMLVDTLFDLPNARTMFDELRDITADHPISAAMNTHGNGDHCWGNQLLPDGIPVYATSAADAEIRAVPPALLQALAHIDESEQWRSYYARTFGRFDFDGIELTPPTDTFSGSLELHVGDRAVSLIEVGPAHTAGDAILHVPDAGVVFTGDILFVEGTPVMWHGPTQNWLDACERILSYKARTLVPGHGPITDDSGVRDVQRYLTDIRTQARERFDAGMDAEAAADDIDISAYADWGDPERIVVNVETMYREFDPARDEVPIPALFLRMAAWAARH